MKPIYKSLTLAAMTLQVTIALQAQVTNSEDATDMQIPAELLDALRVELVSPNLSGARDLIKSGECTIDGNELTIELATGEWIKGGTYRVQVLATFGTQTQVIYTLDITVPRYEALSNETQEFEDEVLVISTVGDGALGIDPDIYQGGTIEGNAKFAKVPALAVGDATLLGTEPAVSVGGDGVTSKSASVAFGATDVGARIEASKNGCAFGYSGGQILASESSSFAHGEADNGNILASELAAHAEGYVTNDGTIEASGRGAYARGSVGRSELASIGATADGAVASGCATGDDEDPDDPTGSKITSSDNGAHAFGNAGKGGEILSDGLGALANGCATYGGTIQASADGAVASGIAVSGGQIVASEIGATANGYATDGGKIEALGEGAHAEGYADENVNPINASGKGSHAEGYETTADGDFSHAEGSNAFAHGGMSHSEGYFTEASGGISHAEGEGTKTEVNATGSHAEGKGTIAASVYQHVSGQFNVADSNGDYALIVGNGTADDARSNAFAIDWNGNLVLFNAGTPVVLTPAKLAQLIA